jgi:tripartite ATP-independent transporter DctM subunit
MITLASIFLVCLAVLGLPLFAVLGAGGLVGAWASDLDFAVLVVEMNRVSSSPNLVAIPLFTFAGTVLAAGGAPKRMVRLFSATFGWMPGGIAVVALTSCAFFTAFSGASGITILALGGLLFPILVQGRYHEQFSLGLVTASGSLGLLFAPSLAILLYGVVARVNIHDLFLAGFVPGLLLLIMLGLYSAFVGRRFSIPTQRFSFGELRKAVIHGFWDILLPLGIIVGVFGGFLTIAEAAACTTAYVLVMELAIHRTLRLDRRLFLIIRDAAILVGSILIILSTAMGLTNLLIDAQIPTKLLAALERSISSQLGFLLLLNVFLLIVGAMMDIFSALIVIIPLILPVAMRFGVDPVHLGIIFLANLEIGYCTPPVGMNLFISSQRLHKPILSCFRAAMPFLMIMFVWLVVVTYFPFASLWWKA